MNSIYKSFIIVLHIVNAPKAGVPQYIVYDDVCCSPAELRKSKMYLQHIIPWNMLLVVSANCSEVNLLSTADGGEFPSWVLEFPADVSVDLLFKSTDLMIYLIFALLGH